MLPDQSFPEPKALDILEIGNNKDMRTMTYGVANPHPGYMKDPNILNEMGHTVYPKMIYPNGKHETGVIVKNKEEEEKLMGEAGNQLAEQLDSSIENMKRKIAEMEETKKRLEAASEKAKSSEQKAW